MMLSTHRTDAELLLAAKADPQAFREFYERYVVWTRAWFYRHTGNEAVALDLVAETFAQAWRCIGRFEDMADGSGAPWLFGIARNLLRQYHKHNRIETAARARLGLPLNDSGVGEYDDVDDRISAVSMGPRIASAMDSLPADQRLAVQLRVVDQLTYEEVAQRLGCSINAVRLRVSRALRALTTELREAV